MTPEFQLLQKLHEWRIGYATDRFMAGVIRADKVAQRGRRCECGGSYAHRKRRDFENEIPVCVLCGETPELYFIRITLPVLGEHEIRYFNGDRIRTASMADACLKQVRGEVKAGTFDPLKYLAHSRRSEFLFRNFAAYYQKVTPMSASSRASVRTSLENYLLPAFGERFVQDITAGEIERFRLEWKPVGRAKTTRSREVALECLHAVLGLAKRLQIISALPAFPKIQRSRKARQRLPADVQQAVIERMRDPYRAAVEAMRLLLCRPSEIRALQWRDLDFERKIVHLRRHFSKGGELRDGRKSVEDLDAEGADHQVPFGDELLAVLSRMPRSLNPEAWVFLAPAGGRPGAAAPRTLSSRPLTGGSLLREWRAALDAYNTAHQTSFDVDLYRGIKSSTVTHLEQQGVAREDLRKLAGHKTADMTGRYSSDAIEHLRGVTEGVIVRLRTRGEGGAATGGDPKS
jgi:integrase